MPRTARHRVIFYPLYPIGQVVHFGGVRGPRYTIQRRRYEERPTGDVIQYLVGDPGSTFWADEPDLVAAEEAA